MSLPATDDFDRGPNNDPIGANWTGALGSGNNFRLFSNQVFCDQAGAVEALAYWNADVAPADQTVSLTRTGAGSGVIGPTARVSAGLGYGLWLDAAGTVSKWTGGPSRTDLGSSSGFAFGDRGTITVIGTGIEVFVNGVSSGTFTDASVATGSFGMHGYVDSGSLADDWAGDAVGPYVPPVTEDFVADAAGMGWIEKSDASWDTAHDAASGTVGSANPSIAYAANNAGLYGIGRVFVPVDTSALRDDDEIVSASLFMHSDSVLNGDPDAEAYIVVVGPTSQASPTALAGADFDQCGAVNSPQELSARINLSDMGLDSWIEFVLNGAGLAAIDPGGHTLLGLREGHDVTDAPVATTTFSFASFYTPAESGKEPYLSVTYRRSSILIPIVRHHMCQQGMA